MNLMEVMQELGISVMDNKAKINCKVFEDNSGALNIATLPKLRPRTKYINIKYWHFREHLEQGKITIHTVSTKDQIVDMLTKPLAETDFEELKARIMGKERGEVYSVLKGSVENNEEECFPQVTDRPVLRDEKRNKGNKKVKTRVNSASPNVISAQGTTPNGDLKCGTTPTGRGTTPTGCRTGRGTTPTGCSTTPTGDLDKVTLKLRESQSNESRSVEENSK